MLVTCDCVFLDASPLPRLATPLDRSPHDSTPPPLVPPPRPRPAGPASSPLLLPRPPQPCCLIEGGWPSCPDPLHPLCAAIATPSCGLWRAPCIATIGPLRNNDTLARSPWGHCPRAIFKIFLNYHRFVIKLWWQLLITYSCHRFLWLFITVLPLKFRDRSVTSCRRNLALKIFNVIKLSMNQIRCESLRHQKFWWQIRWQHPFVTKLKPFVTEMLNEK